MIPATNVPAKDGTLVVIKNTLFRIMWYKPDESILLCCHSGHLYAAHGLTVDLLGRYSANTIQPAGVTHPKMLQPYFAVWDEEANAIRVGLPLWALPNEDDASQWRILGPSTFLPGELVPLGKFYSFADALIECNRLISQGKFMGESIARTLSIFDRGWSKDGDRIVRFSEFQRISL